MIPLIDLVAQYHSIQPEIDAALRQVLESGQFILGPNVSAFESEVASYLGVQHAIGVASGTDALLLALRALNIGPGDEVIIPAYTFFATAGTVMAVGAKPVFVDVDPETYCLNVEQAAARITSKTRAMIPVHLYGQPANMEAVLSIAQANGLKIIEDNAQAFGATYGDRKTGSLGDIGCLSFFPTKNLGAYGDGGMVTTNDAPAAERIRKLRTHGWKKKYFTEELGYNSRLDAMQAAILRVKLTHVDDWNDRRRALAHRYNERLAGTEIILPHEVPGGKHVYHLYVIRVKEREKVQSTLKEAGIAAEVYYPVPPHLTLPCQQLGYKPGDFPVAEQASRETLAIPFFPEMTDSQMDTVVTALKRSIQQ